MIAAIGSFDGFHLGHRKLFEAAEYLSRVMSDSWCVVTFFPHPQLVLGHRTFLPLFSERKDILGNAWGFQNRQLDFSKTWPGWNPISFLEDRLSSGSRRRGLPLGDRGAAPHFERAASRRGKVGSSPWPPLPGKIGSSYIRERVIRVPSPGLRLGEPLHRSGVLSSWNEGNIGFPTINLSLPGIKAMARALTPGGF